MADWTPPKHVYRDQSVEPEEHGQIPIPGVKGHERPPKGQYVKPGSPLHKQSVNPHVWGTIAGHHNPFLHSGMDHDKVMSTYDWENGHSTPHDEEKAQDHLQRLVDKSHPAIRVSHHVLHKVLDEGRFKSQFETQTSRGTLNNGLRAKLEERKFEYPDHIRSGGLEDNDWDEGYGGEDEDDEPPPQHPAHARPIYGYLSHEHLGDDDNVDHYGAHKVVLHKPSIWHRTSVSFGDSLNHHSEISPSPVQKVSVESFHPSVNDENTYRNHMGDEADPPHKRIMAIKHFGRSRAASLYDQDKDDGQGAHTSDHPEGMGHNYAEAQFHGGVTTHDIHYVQLGREHDTGDNDSLKKKLNHHGIPWIEASHGQILDSPKWSNHKDALFNRTTLAVESYLRLMERHAMGQVKVVAQQGNDRYLLSETSDPQGMVRVADTKARTLSREIPLQSMLKQGYWEKPESGVNATDILAIVKP
jgi:hypothetical protein